MATAVSANHRSITSDHSLLKLSSGAIAHSERRLFTGLAKAAFIARELMVIKVITIAIKADKINTDGPIVIR